MNQNIDFEPVKSKLIGTVLNTLASKNKALKRRNSLKEEMSEWAEFDDVSFMKGLASLGRQLPKGELRSKVAKVVKDHQHVEGTKPQKPDFFKALGTQNRYYTVPGRSKSIKKADTETKLPPLDQLFVDQRFNGKPELVSYASDLLQRKDLIDGKDGTPLILYKGFSNRSKHDQFMGLGPKGDIHIPGLGVYGNGSYAVSRGSDPDQKASDSQAHEIAKLYTGSRDPKIHNKQVLAFGIRKGSNVLEFKNQKALWKWAISAQQILKSKLGYLSEDPGEIAAALGYHAYSINQDSGEKDWVILNRGCLVAAINQNK